jgi:hypothetical protein
MADNISAVIYEPLPDDPSSGRILWSTVAPPGAMAMETRPWVPTLVYDADYDRSHKVEAGQLVQTHRWLLDAEGRRVGLEPI